MSNYNNFIIKMSSIVLYEIYIGGGDTGATYDSNYIVRLQLHQ